jgi:hypothetical protein
MAEAIPEELAVALTPCVNAIKSLTAAIKAATTQLSTPAGVHRTAPTTTRSRPRSARR